MATLGVIPARLASVRLPRKPLRDLAGEPLIVRVWQRVESLQLLDAVVVATDSDEVADICARAGARTMLTSSGHPSGTDRVAEVARSAPFKDYDVIVNIQGDEPFVSAEAVQRAASLVSTGSFVVGTTAVRAALSEYQSPDSVKVVFADDGRALYFSRAPIPALRDDSDKDQHLAVLYRHIGIYAYTRDALLRWVELPQHPFETVERLEQLRPLAAGMAIGVAVVDEAIFPGIDTEDDLTFANEHWNAFTSGIR